MFIYLYIYEVYINEVKFKKFLSFIIKIKFGHQ